MNGFGRIGRNFLRCWLGPRDNQLQLVGINDTSELKTNAHLLKYDLILGKLDADIQVNENSLIIND